jgi:hypothetical protein
MELEVLFRNLVREEIQPLVAELKALRCQSVERPKREFWLPREVAQKFGFKDTQTIRGWCKAGKLNAERDIYSNQWRIPQEEVDYLESTGGKPRPLSQAS